MMNKHLLYSLSVYYIFGSLIYSHSFFKFNKDAPIESPLTQTDSKVNCILEFRCPAEFFEHRYPNLVINVRQACNCVPDAIIILRLTQGSFKDSQERRVYESVEDWNLCEVIISNIG